MDGQTRQTETDRQKDRKTDTQTAMQTAANAEELMDRFQNTKTDIDTRKKIKQDKNREEGNGRGAGRIGEERVERVET